MAFARFVVLYRKYNPDQPRDDRGRWTDTGGDAVDVTGSTTPIVNEARTGDIEIDSISQKLAQKLADVVDTLGPGSGPTYGTAVHRAFADAVQNSGIPGVEVETTSKGGVQVWVYGMTGSVRTDVILRGMDDSGSVRAIWDVKTGNATLNPSRVDDIRRQVGVGQDVPVIELNLIKGTLIKARLASSDAGAVTWRA